MAKSVYERFGTSNLAGSDQISRRYTFKGGDTLPLIASIAFNTGYDSELWRQIAEAQSPPIDDLDNIAIGTVLVIPSVLPTS
jgi:nucleoid-associated protein YgaU